MRMRSTLLLFIALLGVATFAGAAAPAPSPAFMAPACAADASTLPAAGLVPSPLAAANSVCGACSQNPCKNQLVATTCFISNRRGSCQSPNADFCPETTTWNCQCYVGPL
jgi:hypothetical protein